METKDANTQNQSSQNTGGQQILVVKGQKNVFLAFLLSFLFGPLGMLYSTVIGAVVMFIVNVIAIIFTGGIGLVITIPIGIAWAVIAAINYNKALTSNQ